MGRVEIEEWRYVDLSKLRVVLGVGRDGVGGTVKDKSIFGNRKWIV